MIGEGCEFIGGTLEVDCQGFSIMSKNNDLLNRPGSRDAIASKKYYDKFGTKSNMFKSNTH